MRQISCLSRAFSHRPPLTFTPQTAFVTPRHHGPVTDVARDILQKYQGHLIRRSVATLSNVTSNHEVISDTIYALSTAPGRAAIAVIRVSGPKCLDIYNALCPKSSALQPRRATLRRILHPQVTTNAPDVLDPAALTIYFPAPKTVTGEDILEFHVHGGPATVKAVLQAIPLCKSQGNAHGVIRFAEAGEFTKRAFYNARADLVQIEALGDTLVAETEQQRRMAVKGSTDSLATRYQSWRQDLLLARAELEALIDFSEDQHFDESPTEFVRSVNGQVEQLKLQIELHINNAAKGELLRNGISIALLGAPNAGKSSLLNRVVGREAAIVSAEEGTTRDVVDVSVDIGGWLCRLGDMAGLRGNAKSVTAIPSSAIGAVEKEGIRRAKERALSSDLVCIILSVEQHVQDPPQNCIRGTRLPRLSIDQEVIDAASQCSESGKTLIIAINKIDRLPADDYDAAFTTLQTTACKTFPFVDPHDIFPISCKPALSPSPYADPGNIQALLRGLTKIFSRMTSSDRGPPSADDNILPLAVTHRQAAHLQACRAHLAAFQACTDTPHVDGHADLVSDGVDIVAAAEHLRFAAECLAKITGRGGTGDVEDVLGVVFEKFCVGK